MVKSLAHRAQALSSSVEEDEKEIEKIIHDLKLNDYPDWFLNKTLNENNEKPNEPDFKTIAMLLFIPGVDHLLNRIFKSHKI